jgi:hypothetical protein
MTTKDEHKEWYKGDRWTDEERAIIEMRQQLRARINKINLKKTEPEDRLTKAHQILRDLCCGRPGNPPIMAYRDDILKASQLLAVEIQQRRADARREKEIKLCEKYGIKGDFE